MSDILTTTGVNSTVWVGDAILGHIALIDYDENAYLDMRDDTANLTGINALFESSPGSWHVWNLTVRDKDETSLFLLERLGDLKHARIGHRRGFWTLRIAQKTRTGGDGGREVYKDPPKLLDVWANGPNVLQSKPHLKLLIAIAKTGDRSYIDPEKVERIASEYPLSGRAYSSEKYMTLTDRMKERLGDGR